MLKNFPLAYEKNQNFVNTMSSHLNRLGKVRLTVSTLLSLNKFYNCAFMVGIIVR